MLEEAVNRISPLVGIESVYISTSLGLKHTIEDSKVVGRQNVLAEPSKRNTLGALCWTAACLIAEGKGDATVAVLTADHLIGKPEAFRATVSAAMDIAEETKGLVTIGIVPDRPETGYGYIECNLGSTVASASGRSAYQASSFREKPNEENAKAMVAAGNFYWNAGMFFYSIPSFIRELQSAAPQAADVLQRLVSALKARNETQANSIFDELPNLSIDYALMEKAQCVYCVPSDFPWDDVGAWDALERAFANDAAGNTVIGKAVMVDAKGSIVMNESDRTVVGVLGVEDIVVVVTDGAVLVCSKSEAQRVREISKIVNG